MKRTDNVILREIYPRVIIYPFKKLNNARLKLHVIVNILIIQCKISTANTHLHSHNEYLHDFDLCE